MTIYVDKIQIKIDAIEDKDLQWLVDHNVYIPWLGDDYTLSELEAWVNDILDFLQTAKISDDSTLTGLMNSQYNTLTSAGQDIADLILADEDYDLSLAIESDYYKLRKLIIYMFATTP